MIERWLMIADNRSSLLVGPRRAGKTTILKGRFTDLPYFTLDDYDLLSLARSDPKKLVALIGPRGILDEVQRVPELLIAVKYGIDELRQVILMTGSSTLGLLSKGSETLAGRIQIIECPTFCWGEEQGPPTHDCFELPDNPLQLREANRNLDLAIMYGGFPEVLTSSSEEEKLEVLRNYRNTYFAKDLLLLSNIENSDGLMALLSYLVIALGSHIDISNAARESGLSFPTTKKYLNVLLASRLAFKLYGYHFGSAKRFTRAAKYYFADAGIATALNISLSRGQLFENFVISELEKRRKLGRLRCDHLCYYKSTSGAEIDVIIDEPDLCTAIEIKHTKSPRSRDVRHLRTFINAETSKKRMGVLFYPGEKAFDLHGIRILPVGSLWRCL